MGRLPGRAAGRHEHLLQQSRTGVLSRCQAVYISTAPTSCTGTVWPEWASYSRRVMRSFLVVPL